MYKINEVRIEVDFKIEEEFLIKLIAQKLKIDESIIISAKLDRLSLDARRKNDIHYKGNIFFDVNKKVNFNKFKNVFKYTPSKPDTKKWMGGDKKIIIVGTGPSGLFAGLKLCNSGIAVTFLERGYEMERRISSVEKMMNEGILDEKCNIQFGEGGAGTFSDGKLNTSINSGLSGEVLDTFCQNGASNEILYSNKAHMGTDVLSKVIVNMRKYMISKGCEFLWEHNFKKVVNSEGRQYALVETPNGIKEISFDILILAIGHSSRDTIRELYNEGMMFRQKPFSLGFRIEHLQKDIDYSQYGDMSLRGVLPPADYHLSCHLQNGRCVYTFCMCPGGVIVPATSEKNHVVTNGMSYSARDGVNSNSAILVTVTPSDFSSEHPLAGIELQERLEEYAYNKTNSYNAVVQKVGDFLQSKPSTSLGAVLPTYRPGYVLGSVEDMLPKNLIDSLKDGIVELDKKLKGFASKDALLTGIETRSSAPYQVIRNDDMETSIDNVYMIGEGAGMAGGIISSAVEGLKVANIIIEKYK